MTDRGQGIGLRVIFSIFLGLMLTALVGVGVYTFHRPPERLDQEIRDIKRQEQTIRDSKPARNLTPADREQIQELVRERNQLVDTAEQTRKKWALSTSIILIVLATLAMAISLAHMGQAVVISNGLLLGGVFTMLYGIGWIATADTSITRFVVMTVAFVIAVALGYARFARRGTAPATATGTPGIQGTEDIDRRLQKLEERLDDAARALTRGHDE